MIKLTTAQQRSLFAKLVDMNAFKALDEEGRILRFVSQIWDIDTMASSDPRYNTMRGDIQQHYINNSDWDEHYLFAEKLGLYKDSDKYQSLIELLPSNEFQEDEELASQIVAVINSYLLPYGDRLVKDETGPYTHYEVKDINDMDGTSSHNTIPFVVVRESDKNLTHSAPSQYPSFVLVADNWDDYGVKSHFFLFYYPRAGEKYEVGSVKIICNTDDLLESERSYSTKNYLENEFTSLTEVYCSLGQAESYYDNFRKLFPHNFRDILWALRDCGVYSRIEDKFTDSYAFQKSLIRDDKAERLLRDVKYTLEGIPVENRESFKYHFTPPFSDTPVILDVEFDGKSKLPGRLFAVIGENGVGKTQMLAGLQRDISKKIHNAFESQMPLYSKVISVTTNIFDHAVYPQGTDDFNYENIGLPSSDRKAVEDLKEAFNCINEKKDRAHKLWLILHDIDAVESLFLPAGPFGDKHRLNNEALGGVWPNLSSGEAMLLYLLTRIIASVRLDTLLLFDEPETHLHPNAITSLMSALCGTLDEFESYAIVATHSPLVIREVMARHVRIIDRKGDTVTIRLSKQETLGANISQLVDDIFGNKGFTPYYKNRIAYLAKNEGLSAAEIIREIKPEGDVLPIGLQVYIKSVTARHEED